MSEPPVAPRFAAPLIFVGLLAAASPGLFLFLYANPAAFDARSVGLIARYAGLPILYAGIFFLIIWAAGARVAAVSPASERGVPAVAEAVTAGLGLFGTALFVVGVAGWLRATGIFLLTAVLAAIGLPRLRAPRAPGWPARPGTVFESCLLGAIAFALVHGLVVALAPQTGWDVLVYHLALPKLYLREGSIVDLPWLWFSRLPRLMEVVYALPLAIDSEPLSGLIHFGLSALWLGAAFEVARRELGREAAVAAAALLAASRSFLTLPGQAHSDGALALAHFVGALALYRWSQDQAEARLARAGLAFGTAAALKLHGLALLAIWTCWLALAGPPAAARARARRLCLLLAPALAVAGPWYLTTWWRTGNPVWPFVFGGGGASAVVRAYTEQNSLRWADSAGLLGPQVGILQLAVPALAAAIWTAAARKPWPPIVRFLMIPLLPYAVMVFKNVGGWRFLWPCYPALAMLAGWAVAEMRRRGGFPRWIAAAIVLFGLASLPGTSHNNELFAVLQLRSQREPDKLPRQIYLERTLEHGRAFEEINERLPSGRLLLFRETRGYHLKPEYLWGEPSIQPLIDYRALAGPQGLRGRLEDLGISHVLINQGAERFRPEAGIYDRRTLALMDEALRGAPLILERGGVKVYSLARP